MSPYIGFFVGIIFAFICMYVAKKRSRNTLIWFVAGLFFTVFALIILLVLPSLASKTADDEEIKADLNKLQELENTKKSKKGVRGNLPDKLWYYLDTQNQQYGPMTLEALMNEWEEGKIKADTFVWNEELPDWKPLQETSDFQMFQTRRNFN